MTVCEAVILIGINPNVLKVKILTSVEIRIYYLTKMIKLSGGIRYTFLSGIIFTNDIFTCCPKKQYKCIIREIITP